MEKYGCSNSIPIITNTAQLSNDKRNPCSTKEEAFSSSEAPKALAIKIFVPTPVPEATAVIRVCTGKAKDKAARPESCCNEKYKYCQLYCIAPAQPEKA